MPKPAAAPAVEYLNTGAPVAYPTGGIGGTGNVPKTMYALDLSLHELVQMFVVYAFIIAAGLSAIFIFIGGMSFILSGGNDEKIKQAVNTIRYSIVGLIVTILSFTFVTIVGRMFGLNFLDYLSYGQIKDSINRLIQTGQKPIQQFDSGRSGGGFQQIR